MKLEPLPNSTVVDDAIGLYPNNLNVKQTLLLAVAMKMIKKQLSLITMKIKIN